MPYRCQLPCLVSLSDELRPALVLLLLLLQLQLPLVLGGVLLQLLVGPVLHLPNLVLLTLQLSTHFALQQAANTRKA